MKLLLINFFKTLKKNPEITPSNAVKPNNIPTVSISRLEKKSFMPLNNAPQSVSSIKVLTVSNIPCTKVLIVSAKAVQSKVATKVFNPVASALPKFFQSNSLPKLSAVYIAVFKAPAIVLATLAKVDG